MAITLTQAREKLRAEGYTVRDWAERHGFPLHGVRAVLYGRNKGNFGQSHAIAIALGVKDRAN